MAEAWLRLTNPNSATQLRPNLGRNDSNRLLYKFKKPLLSIEAKIFSYLTQEPAGIELEIEFEGKLPFRRPDRYHINATAQHLLASDASEVRPDDQREGCWHFKMTTLNLNRTETETWTQISPLHFRRERSHHKPIELIIPESLRGLVLPAPFAPLALENCWRDDVNEYKGILFAGKTPTALRIRPQLPNVVGVGFLQDSSSLGLESRNSDGGVALKIEVLKLESLVSFKSREDFDSLRWASAQKIKAVYSRSCGLISLFELELPVFGALALHRVEI